MAKKNPPKNKQGRQAKVRRAEPPSSIGPAESMAAPVLDYSPAARVSVPEFFTPGTLIPLLALIIVIGTWGFASGHATIKGNEMSKYQAIFTAANAATLTGFEQARKTNDYTLFGQCLTLLMMLAGIFFSFVAGGIAVVRIARLRFSHWQLAGWSVASIAIAAIVGAVALRGADRTFFQAGYQAISAFGNCGLCVGSLPDAFGPRAHLVVLPLSLLGGFGLPVLMELVDWIRGRQPISLHSRTVLLWSAGAYAAITIVLILLRCPGMTANFTAWQHTIEGASREAVNARSTGFPFESAGDLPQTAATIMILVMIVGAAPGGTAGGLKLTTLAVLTGGFRDLFRRRPAGRPLALAMLWTTIYLAMLLITTLALLICEPGFHLDRTLFLAASALGNVGLSHDPIAVSDAGLCVMSITMLLGRVAPVVMLWCMSEACPEATIAIG